MKIKIKIKTFLDPIAINYEFPQGKSLCPRYAE